MASWYCLGIIFTYMHLPTIYLTPSSGWGAKLRFLLDVSFKGGLSILYNMRRKGLSKARAYAKAAEFSRKLKDLIECPFLGPVPAFAGIPGYCQLPTPSMFKPYCEFHVGDAPAKGAPSRKIMEWGHIDIRRPDQKPTRHNMILPEAQKEVRAILKGDNANHQYIAYEAAKLCRSDEVTRYTLHLMLGAGAEDFVFLPNETLDNTYATPPKRTFRNRRELYAAVDPGEVPSFFGGLFRTVSRLWKRFRSSVDEDSINRPYFGHFYDPTRDDGDKGLNILHGDIRFKSALERMNLYWDYASLLYRKGDKPRAFYALGHLIHLVQDLHVPAHTHNDIHGPTVFLGKLDSFESWCTRADYRHITRPEGNENIKIWDSGPLVPASPDSGWDESNAKQRMAGFVDGFVRETQRFRSVDAEGTDDSQGLKGKLSDEECYQQGSVLIPAAIRNSAQMIVNFLEVHKE
jgi:hypothetical protein